MLVRDLMTSEVVTVTPDTPLKQVAAALVAHRITGVPVVCDGALVGVVSQADIVELEERAEDESIRGRRRRRRPLPPSRTAGDVMRSPVVTIDPRSSAVGAAWSMTRNDVNRLAVVDRGKVVGIVTRSDLIHAFARPDAAVRREIVEEILPSLCVSCNEVSVTVQDGIVTVRGSVEDTAQARCLPHALRGVVGVVDVDSELSVQHEHRPFDTLSASL